MPVASTGNLLAAEELLCTETLSAVVGRCHEPALQQARCNRFGVSENSAFTLLEERMAPAAPALRPRRPIPTAVSPEEARGERLQSTKEVFQRCRNQESRTDFAGDAVHALQGLPSLWRERLIEWLQCVCLKKNDMIRTATIAHAVSLLDSYTSKCSAEDRPETPAQYQLCAITAFNLACKYREQTTVAKHISNEFGRRFDPARMAALERKMIDVIHWRLSPVTVHDLTSMFVGTLSDELKSVDPSNPVERRASLKMAKRLDGIATVFLDLQLSVTGLLNYSRPALVLGTVAAACSIYSIPFYERFSHRIHDLFTEAEVDLCPLISRECQHNFFRNFPDLVKRCPSPPSVMGVDRIS